MPVSLPLIAKISPRTQYNISPAQEINSFGEGFGEAVTRLNPSNQRLRLVWDYIGASDTETLVNFFRDNIGEIIEYSPTFSSSTFRYRIVGDARVEYLDGTLHRVTVNLLQVYNAV